MNNVDRALTSYWPKVESFSIDSPHIDHPLEISIARLPASDAGASSEPMVVYLLDASFDFSAAVSGASFLGNFARLAGGRWPSLTIVGVGYPVDDPREVMARRAQDLTPTSSGAPEGVALPPLAFGGAPAFLAALREDVIAAVEKRLEHRMRERLLVGHSFGGLFGAYTLFHRPETFDGYLLISPSVWWDDRIVMRYEQARADSHEPLTARVFIAVGEKEQAPGGGWKNEGFPDDAIRRLRQVENVREFAATLGGRGYRGFKLETNVFADEYHLTIFPAAFGRGLRWLVDQQDSV